MAPDRTADDAEDPSDGPDRTPVQPPSAAPYPGWIDEQLLTPRAPLPPGAEIRVLPLAIDPSPPAAVPAAWAPDPTGRHQWRWWGGATWTDHVADDGVATEDPLQAVDADEHDPNQPRITPDPSEPS